MQGICRWPAYGYVQPIRVSPFFSADPKKGSSGSPTDAPARCGAETQDVPLGQLRLILYIVFTPCPATARSPPETSGVVIPCA